MGPTRQRGIAACTNSPSPTTHRSPTRKRGIAACINSPSPTTPPQPDAPVLRLRLLKSAGMASPRAVENKNWDCRKNATVARWFERGSKFRQPPETPAVVASVPDRIPNRRSRRTRRKTDMDREGLYRFGKLTHPRSDNLIQRSCLERESSSFTGRSLCGMGGTVRMGGRGRGNTKKPRLRSTGLRQAARTLGFTGSFCRCGILMFLFREESGPPSARRLQGLGWLALSSTPHLSALRRPLCRRQRDWPATCPRAPFPAHHWPCASGSVTGQLQALAHHFPLTTGLEPVGA
jgi:hypothetical protein